MKTTTLIFIFLSTTFVCFAQQGYCDYEEAELRERLRENYRSIAFSVVEQHAQSYTDGRNFLIFLVGRFGNYSHLILIEEKDFFRELLIRDDSLMNMEVREPNQFLRLAFDKTIYHTGTKFGFDFPKKNSTPHIFGSNSVYFVFVDKDNNFYGESITSTLMPLINADVHFYLSSRALGIEMSERRRWHRFRFNFRRER